MHTMERKETSPMQMVPQTSGETQEGFVTRASRNWMARHQLPFNFWIHLIGIPTAVLGLCLLISSLFLPVPWYWGVGGLVLGYLLQWIGHLAEGNDVGEWAGIKRLLGLPYVGISPRFQKPQQPPSSV
jgi:hypothetical protein